MKYPRRFDVASLCAASLCCAPLVFAADGPTQLLWGDTHLHTSHSVDAYATGNYFADPATAYRFAMGLPVLHPVTREKIRIERPLDFLVVADHAENLGLQVRLDHDDPELMATATGRRLAELQKSDKRAVFAEVGRINQATDQSLQLELNSDAIRGGFWKRTVATADLYNQPGRFTALIGWEWSSMPNWANLHRVVFTSADAATAGRFIPFSSIQSSRPEDLWRWLDQTSRETGAQFVAIPHNSNMSNGTMFDTVDSDGKPLTAEYARNRERWEVVMEITQTKGTSETAPSLSPNDEFAAFEVRNKLLTGPPSKETPAGFARTALLQGLRLEAETGVNPYRFGVVGSSDSHNSLSSVEEYNYQGKLGSQAITEQRPKDRSNFSIWELSASGLAGVWAKANSRQDILDAFRRREVYGTSGPRIALRMFAGWDFSAADGRAKDISVAGYRRGVPMGSGLPTAPRGQHAPTLMIEAARDPLSGNLDRLQVVKGWLDAAGAVHEKIYDVAWSGERKSDPDGRLPPVGNTVDAQSATFRNDIGAPQLAAVWKDPQFDPSQRAFYYVRVLEIPTPRHSTYDAVALQIPVEQTKAPVWIQERAWSSPVWYTPH
jgi:hypothetical protein